MSSFRFFLAIIALGLVSGFSRLRNHVHDRGGLSTPNRSKKGMVQDNWEAVGKRDVLYDIPVSNHGARCRLIAYAKKLGSRIEIASPQKLGGLKSPAYVNVFSNGKMPGMLTAENYPITESDTICRYMLDKYNEEFPSFIPPSAEQRVLNEQIIRTHDIYMSPVQGCMYRASSAGFGSFGSDRQAALKFFLKQLGDIEQMLDRFELYFDTERARLRAGDEAKRMFDMARDAIEGDTDGKKSQASSDRKAPQPYQRYRYLTGDEIALADATLFPTVVFAFWMIPRFFSHFDIPGGGYRLKAWYTFMSEDVPAAKKVREEIEEALEEWEFKGRWKEIISEVEQWELPIEAMPFQ